MRVIFIRHGKSEANLDKSVYLTTPDHYIELAPIGKEQALSVGNELNLLVNGDVEFFVSPYVRTKQTAEIIQQCLKFCRITRITEDPTIREQEWAQAEDADEVIKIMEERKNFGEYWYRFMGSESEADVNLRAKTFLLDIQLRKCYHNITDTVIVVSHEIFIRNCLAIIENKPFDKIQMDIQNCFIYMAEV